MGWSMGGERRKREESLTIRGPTSPRVLLGRMYDPKTRK